MHVSARARSVSCSYCKVEDDVPVAIDLDDVLKFRIGDHGHCSLQNSGEFQRQTYASLFHQAEMVIFAEVGCQIECVQVVSVCIFVASDKQAFVGAQFARSSKYGVVRSYILSRCKVWLDGSQSVLLLPVQVKSNLVQIEISKVERIPVSAAVKCSVVHQSDCDARR